MIVKHLENPNLSNQAKVGFDVVSVETCVWSNLIIALNVILMTVYTTTDSPDNSFLIALYSEV